MSDDLMRVLVEVITSWQVIAATIAIILFISLVLYVARMHRRPRSASMSFNRPKRKKPVISKPAKTPEKTDVEDDINDELGLEEE